MRGLALIVLGCYSLGAVAHVDAQEKADPGDSYFPLVQGRWWKYRIQREGIEGIPQERTINLGKRSEIKASYHEKGTASSWRGEKVLAWSLTGFESQPVYVVEVENGIKILAYRRAARGPSGIFTVIPAAVCLWGEDNSWDFYTRVDEGRTTPTVKTRVTREEDKVVTPAGDFTCLKFTFGSSEKWLARGVGIVKQVIKPGDQKQIWELTEYNSGIVK